MPCHGYKDILDISLSYELLVCTRGPACELFVGCTHLICIGVDEDEEEEARTSYIHYTSYINSVGTGSVCQDLELKMQCK